MNLKNNKNVTEHYKLSELTHVHYLSFSVKCGIRQRLD